MALIRYPHRVRHKGAFYAPGAPIEVDDPDKYIRQGAELIESSYKQTAKPEEKPKPARRKKRNGGDAENGRV